MYSQVVPGGRRKQTSGRDSYDTPSLRTIGILLAISGIVGAIIVILWLANLFPGLTSPLVKNSSSACNPNLMTCTNPDLSGFAAANSTVLSQYFYVGKANSNNVAWGTRWVSRLVQSRAGVGQVRMVVDGANNGQGWLSSNPRDVGWVARIQTGLQAQFGIGGDGLIAISMSPSPTAGSNYEQYGLAETGVRVDPTWYSAFVNSSANININNYGLGPGGVFLSTGTTSSATFMGRGSQFEVWYGIDCYASSYLVQVDNGAPMPLLTVNPYGCNGSTKTNGSAGFFTRGWPMTDTTQWLSAWHTVVVAAAGGGSNYLSGVRFTNPTGVVIDNISRGWRWDQVGITVTGSNTGGGTSGYFDLLPGNPSGYWGNPGPSPTSGNPYGPLAYTCGSINPCDFFLYAIDEIDVAGYLNGWGGPPASYLSGVLAMLQAVQAQNNGQVDVLLVIPIIDQNNINSNLAGGNQFTNGGGIGTHTTAWLAAVQSAIPQFQAAGISVLDVGGYYGASTASSFVPGSVYTNFLQAGGWGNADQIGAGGTLWPFFSDHGHQLFADLVYAAVTDQLSGSRISLW